MKRKARFLLGAIPAAPVLFLGVALANTDVSPKKLNLLLISIDTLRADYLGCYGGRAAATPNIDALAGRGVLFKRAFAHNPLTLPSHANILTGLTPLGHGIHDNLGFRLSSTTLTLAEHLKKQDYQTAAFVGAFPLDSRFGLAKGFDIYDDFYGEKASPGSFFFTERRGEEVVGRALTWLRERGKDRWFLFLHLFDPHQPYAPPSPFAEKYARNLYAGEVSYADDCLGRLFRFLGQTGLEAETLIILTSDHGESLGEHGEDTHGYFAYNSTLHVPLIFWAPRLFKEKIVLDGQASHADIFPTACALFGLTAPDALHGRSLLPLIEKKTSVARPIYFESLAPSYNRNWAPLRGVIQGKLKYIDQPLPELYDLGADFQETDNIFSRERAALGQKTLAGLMAEASKVKPQTRVKEGKDVEKAMRSLGYLAGQAGSSKTSFTSADDLKTLLPVHRKLMEAVTLFSHGRSQPAIQILEDILDEDKDLMTAYEYLANIYYQDGDKDKAVGVLEKGLSVAPSHVQMKGRLGIFLVELGRLDRALKVLLEALALDPDDAELWNYLGVCYWQLRQFERAEESYNRALVLDANYASAFNNLGSLYLSRSDPDGALRFFDKAIAFDPRLASAYNGKAVALSMKGRLEDSVVFWQKAVACEPRHQMALYNLGLALLKLNKPKDALPYLERYLELLPQTDPEREKISQLVNSLKASIK